MSTPYHSAWGITIGKKVRELIFRTDQNKDTEHEGDRMIEKMTRSTGTAYAEETQDTRGASSPLFTRKFS